MSFDKIIGYAQTKKALLPLLEMLKGDKRYAELGAILPHGAILRGEHHVGKTLFAKTLMEESGRPCAFCQDGKIADAFSQAASQGMSIVLFDNVQRDQFSTILKEMDKPESQGVFVLATTSNEAELSDDILRPEHFSFAMSVPMPNLDDIKQILTALLSKIKTAPDIDIPALAKIMNGQTYTVLQTVINSAAMQTACVGEPVVTEERIVEAYIRDVQNSPDSAEGITLLDTVHTAYHEAGHVVAAELLHPGTVTLAYIRKGYAGTFGKTCYYLPAVENCHMSVKRDSVIKTLAGRAITEMRLGELDTGCCGDLENAYRAVMSMVVDRCSLGFSNGLAEGGDTPSETLKAQREKVVAQEMERYYTQAKELLAANMPFVDALAQRLLEKETLTQADIRDIRERLG